MAGGMRHAIFALRDTMHPSYESCIMFSHPPNRLHSHHPHILDCFLSCLHSKTHVQIIPMYKQKFTAWMQLKSPHNMSLADSERPIQKRDAAYSFSNAWILFSVHAILNRASNLHSAPKFCYEPRLQNRVQRQVQILSLDQDSIRIAKLWDSLRTS